ncbi:response regulator [Cohnella cellulosilytica]|uniref:Response regulator n=1 Tax=Cohnella cellulosilytica TaxID=986710 RepID=A0ABW2F4N2_9BACL
MSAITLVIADDQPIIRNGLAAMLGAEADFEVAGTASDGAEAIEVVARERPQLVLMDIHMPNMDGLAAARILKQRFPGICIVMLTTFSDGEYIEEAIKAGASGYLLKDMELDPMMLIMKDCLSGRISYPAAVRPMLATALEQAAAGADSNGNGWDNLGVSFTDREREILDMLLEGRTNREIANALFLGEGTIKNYLVGCYAKMRVSHRGEATAWLRKRLGGQF